MTSGVNAYYININHIDLVEDDLICAYVYSLSDMTTWDGDPVNITGGSWNKIIIGETGPELDEEFNQSKYPIFEGFVTEELKDNGNDIVYISANQTLEAVNDYFGEIFVLAQ